MAKDTNIGIKISTDVADLKTGIKSIKDEISRADKDFQKATAGLDRWSTSSEGLEAKLTQLNTKLNSQKKSVELYQAEIERVSKLEGDHSAELENLKDKLESAEIAVKKTEKEINHYSNSLEDVTKKEKEAETELGKLTKKISEQESELKDLQNEYKDAVITYGRNSKEAKNLSRQIGDLSDDLENNQKQVKQADKQLELLDKQFDDTGDSAEDFSKGLDGIKSLGATVGKGIATIGASVGALAGAFLATASETKEFRTNMGKLEAGFETSGLKAEQASDTYKKLFSVVADEGKATEATAMLGQLVKSQEDLNKWVNISTGVYATFGDSLPIENLAEASLETSKTGKITGGLADALNWAGISEEGFQKALDKCTTEQERQKLITETLNKTYDDASKKYQQVNKDVLESNRAQVELTDTIAELGKIAEPIMTSLKKLTTQLLQSIKPFVKLIGEGLQGALNGTAGASQKLSDGLGGIINVLIEKVTNLLPSILTLIVQLIPTIVNSLLAQLPALLDLVINVFTQLVGLILEMTPQIINTIVAIIPQLIDSITNALPIIVTTIMTFLPALINSLINAIPVLLDGAIQLLMSIVNAIPVIIEALVPMLPSIINTILTAVLNAYPQLLDGAIKLFNAIVKAIPTILKLLVKELPNIISTIVSALINGLPDILNGAIQLFLAIIKAIPELTKELKTQMPNIIKAIVKGLLDGLKDIKQVGIDLVKGLWNGIKDMTSWVTDKLKGFGDSVLGGIKKFFGINSPSKEMAKIGNYLDEGLVVGIEKGQSDVIDAGEHVGEKFMNAVSGSVDDVKNYFSDLAVEPDINVGGGFWNNFISETAQALNIAKEELETFADEMKTKISAIGDGFKELGKTIFDAFNQSIDNQIKQLDFELEKQRELEKQGIISQEELAQAEQETLKKKNALAKKQFNAQKANDIAQATIQGALAIMKGFAELGPIGGAVNAALQAGITATQIGTIASQKFIPMLAKGGIVNGPTLAMVGEAGKEAVMPLENNTGWIRELAEKLNEIMKKDFSFNAGQLQLNPAMAQSPVVNNYYYQTIQSPQQLNRREIYRDTKNLLSLKGM